MGNLIPIVSDLNIYRSAKLLVGRYGDGATIEAMKRADALAAQSDAAGKVTWRRLEAIEKLQSTAPVGPVH